MKLDTVPGQPGHLSEVLAVCFPSTPPVENSEVVGGPSTEDGQGACTLDLTVHYPDLNFPVRFVGLSWSEFETLFRSVALESPLAWFEVSVMA